MIEAAATESVTEATLEEGVFEPDVTLESFIEGTEPDSSKQAHESVQEENIDNAAADIHRRAGLDANFDVNLALLKRVKKISINLPSIRDDGKRLQNIILPAKDFKHIYDEFRGGYGAPSRPDLELQVLHFGKGLDGNDKIVEILFCSGRCGYILSERIEDQLIAILYNIRPATGFIKNAYLCVGEKKLSCLDKLRQRFWRKFVSMYIEPQFDLPNRVAEAEERILTFSKMTKEEIERQDAVAQYSAAEVAYEDTDSDDTPRKKSNKKKSAKGKRRGKAEKKGI